MNQPAEQNAIDVESQPRGFTETLFVSCPVCQSDAAETLGVTGDMSDAMTGTVVMQCDHCRAVYLSPAPLPAGATTTAPGADWRSYRRWIGPLPHAPELLVADPTLRDIPAGSCQVRLIVMPYLLETADRPAALLQHAATLLANDGRIVIVTGNAGSSSFRRFAGRHWSGYRYPMARQLFGPRSIRRLVEGGPLRISRMTSAYQPDAWVESLGNWLRDWGASARLTRVLTGRWGLPQTIAAAAEGLAVLLDRGSILLVELEK